MSNLVIAIDGPAGAGKTTIAKRIAKDLNLSFLDTGAMYRCVALLAIRRGLTPDCAQEAAEIAGSCQIQFESGEPQRVILNGEDVTAAIRAPEIGDFASAVSVHGPVRRKLVEQQKAIVSKGRIILEGRDTTTVVAPDATLKVYLTASSAVRAERRYKELIASGMKVDLDTLRSQIEERDTRDSTREDSPLKVAEDAVVLSTDGLTVEDVVREVEALSLRGRENRQG